VWIGPVDDELDRARLPSQYLVAEVGRNVEPDFRVPAVDLVTQVSGGSSAASDVEIAAVLERGREGSTVSIACLVEHERGQVVDHRVDGVAEEDELHDRQEQHHRQGATVVADLEKLFTDDGDNSRRHRSIASG